MVRPGAEHLRQRARWCKGLLTVLALLAPAVGASAEGDFAANNQEWNGLSELVASAEGAKMPLIHPRTLDLAALSPVDAILILHPTSSLPVRDLAAFLHDGGRVALADDYGAGDELFSTYNISHTGVTGSGPNTYRGNAALPIAVPSPGHSLTEGLNGVVTNHPTELSHPGLTPLLAFPGSSSALMLSGAVGKGRLLVIGDPSMFINEMLAFKDNRRLASRILTYLNEGGGRLYLVTGDDAWKNAYGRKSDKPWGTLNAWVRRLAAVDLPPPAVRLMSVTLTAILLLMAATALPRRTPYRAARMFPIPAADGGDEGRVRYYGEKNRDLLWPMLLHKSTFETELLKALGMSRPVLLKDIVQRATALGVDAAAVARTKQLLLTLDEAQAREAKGARVTAAELRRAVQESEWILEQIGRNA